jgi:uncharacterized protein (TIGR03118 family)
VSHFFFRVLVGSLGAGLLAIAANAQNTAYQQSNLVSDMAGSAAHMDPLLINPWGVAFQPGLPFWVAANNSGFSQQYDASGNPQAPASVKIPPPAGSTAAATPTGVVYNTTSVFSPATFIFATEDGTISTWYAPNNDNAVLALDHSKQGAVYKGIAILQPTSSAPFLAVANFNSGLVETYTSGFVGLAPAGSFTDPNLPAGYAPFNIQPIGAQVFVTYAVQDAAKHDPVHGAGMGIVDIFNPDGTFVKRFASNGPLNAPWGVVQASTSFGQFSNDILIGNFGDGTINVFDPATGNSLGQISDAGGAPLTNGSLWALVFGAGGTGDPNTLYFTAGLTNEQHGLFGAITVASSATADFALSGSPNMATVTAGQATNFTITTTPMGGFRGTVALSCTAPAGITCSFNPASLTVAANPVKSTLTASTAMRTGGGGGYAQRIGMFLLMGLGMLSAVTLTNAARSGREKQRAWWLGLILLLALVLAAVGCGSSSNSSSMKPGPASITVTAQSGTVSHTTTLTLNVN